MAGYSGTPLIKKLGIKPGQTLLTEDEPADYFDKIGELPPHVQVVSTDFKDPVDFIHLFCRDEESLHRELPVVKQEMDKNGVMWVSWVTKTRAHFNLCILKRTAELKKSALSIDR